MMSDMFIHEIFKIHHRKWPEIHVCLNFSSYNGCERICRIKNSSIKKSSRTIYSRFKFFNLQCPGFPKYWTLITKPFYQCMNIFSKMQHFSIFKLLCLWTLWKILPSNMSLCLIIVRLYVELHLNISSLTWISLSMESTLDLFTEV